MHIGEAIVAALEVVSELRVVQAKQVQQRGVKMVAGKLVAGTWGAQPSIFLPSIFLPQNKLRKVTPAACGGWTRSAKSNWI